MLDGEAIQVGIDFSIIVAVDLGCGICCSYTSAADVQRHLRRIEQRVKEFGARCRRQLAEHVTRRVRESSAKSKDLLILLLRVDRDGFEIIRCRRGYPL